MNMHQQFDMSFFAATLAPHFERIAELGSAGTVEAVNCEALTPRVQALYMQAARQRILQLRAATDALAALLPELDAQIAEQKVAA